MRSIVINKYMCQLSDRDLRLAGTKNTTELMYEAFKPYNNNNYFQHDLIINNGDNSNDNENENRPSLVFKIDRDALELAYKYFMCSTLTIRLSGIVQMNVTNGLFFLIFLNRNVIRILKLRCK